MRKNYLILLGVIAVLFSNSRTANAQCTPLSTSYWGEMLPNNGCAAFANYTLFGPGQYFRMPVLNGGSYSISTCGASIDTQITGFQGTNNTTSIFYNDDFGPDCPSSNQASVDFTPNFSDYVRVNVNQYNCLPGGSSSITVKVRQNNNLAFTSANTDMCAGDTRTLTATPAPISGTLISGSGDGGTFSGAGVAGTTFTAPTPGGASATYTITYTFGYCSTTQNITVYAPPSAADAGADQPAVCGTTATLQAVTPAIGTGTWSIVSGPGTVTTPSDPNSTVTGLVAGSPTTLEWTVANGPCTVNTDQVTLTVDNVGPVPDVASLSDATGECSVTPTAPTASDVCAGVVTGTPDVTFPITTQGTTLVTWTYDDGYGNTSMQTQNVVVDDITAPVADQPTLANITSCTDVTLTAPTATDNCAGSITGTTSTSFPITASGTTVVTWTYDDGNGNTSTQTQNVIIGAPDVSVTQAGATLTANASSGTFQWLDCDNNYQIIAGETNASFTPMAITGNYAVEVTDNGCVDTSACYLVDYTGVQEMPYGVEVNIFPNPSTGKFNVEMIGLSGDDVELRITDLQGRIVFSQVIKQAEDVHVEKVDISENENGVYIIDVIGSKGVLMTRRIVKQ